MRSYLAVNATLATRLEVFATNGSRLAGISSYGPGSPSGYIYNEIFSAAADIAGFEMWMPGREVADISSIIFDDVTGLSSADFRLVYPGGLIEIKPGHEVETSVSVIRLAGSTGPISLQVTNLPGSTLSAQVVPQVFNGASGQTVGIRFQASPFSALNPPAENWPINITGVPSVGAGTTIRQIRLPVTVLEPYDVVLDSMRITQSPGVTHLQTRPTGSGSVRYSGPILKRGQKASVQAHFSFLRTPRRPAPDQEVTLFGSKDGAPLPGNPLRETRLGSRTFEIPETWTIGAIVLEASVDVSRESAWFLDTFDTNESNNSLVVFAIPFAARA